MPDCILVVLALVTKNVKCTTCQKEGQPFTQQLHVHAEWQRRQMIQFEVALVTVIAGRESMYLSHTAYHSSEFFLN